MKAFIFLSLLISSLAAAIELPEEEEALFEPLPELLTIAADTYFSPEVGSLNLLSAYRLFEYGDTPWVKHYLAPLSSWWGVGVRLAEVVLIDFPVAQTTMVVQHEVFGHGAYLRKENIGARYKIFAPTPYGPGGGYTAFSSDAFDALPHYKQSLVTTGGVSATYKMANDLALYRLRRGGCFTVQESILHLFSTIDLTEYVLGLETDSAFINEGNDIAGYIDQLNTYYGKIVLSKSSLKGKILLNLIDPILWNDAYSLGDYVFCGRLGSKPFAFTYGCFSAIPAVRVWLTPYGLEYGTSTFVGYGSMWSLWTLKAGRTEGHGSFSLGVECPYLFRDGDFLYGGKADLWMQPSFEKKGDLAHRTWGGRIGVTAGYRLAAPFLIWGELTAKTRGYLPANVGQANVNFLIGLTYTCR